MRWFGGRESSNVEYGSGGGGKLVGGGIGALVIGLIIYLLGGNPSEVMQQQQVNGGYESHQKADAEKDSLDHFIGVVLAETEDVWSDIFKKMGTEYQKPKLVVFQGSIGSACGYASAAVGPFYCPADEKVYLDKSFFQELKNRFHAPGDFANAYVIAHEVGHHVQRLLGTSDKYEQRRGAVSRTEGNRLSVMMELQADFYAGVWAHYVAKTGDVIEPGDIEAAMNAANAIGDDRLQQESQGTIRPDAFTHGTSQQRMYWFKRGYETGDIRQGDTFKEMSGSSAD